MPQPLSLVVLLGQSVSVLIFHLNEMQVCYDGTCFAGGHMSTDLQHIISVDQLDKVFVEKLFSRANQLSEQDTATLVQTLPGRILGSIFLEPSTRTRMSFASAFMRLGGGVNELSGAEASSLAKGESFADTVRTLENYADILVIRHPQCGYLDNVARHAKVPMINAGDGSGEHPTQALLDLYTILQQKKSLDGLTLVFSGDLNHARTVHSLTKLLMLYDNFRLIFAAPDLLQISDELSDRLKETSINFEMMDDFHAALAQADVLYLTRLQRERIADITAAEEAFRPFMLKREKVEKHCKKDVIVMHPLPRTQELSVDVDALENAVYFQQMANGLWVRMALFNLLLS